MSGNALVHLDVLPNGHVLCEVFSQRLGPDHDQFKIVRLHVSGKWMLLDQGVPVVNLPARALYALASA